MKLNELLDARVTLEGDALPSLREIIQDYFLKETGGNSAIAKLSADRYIQYLGEFEPRSEKTADAKNNTAGKTQQSDPGRTSAGASILEELGVPMKDDGEIDVAKTLDMLISPDAMKTPIGAFYKLIRTASEVGKSK